MSYLYTSGKDYLVSETKLSHAELKLRGFNTGIAYQCFELDGTVKITPKTTFEELPSKGPRSFVVNSSELAKADTWDPLQLQYGCRVFEGKRTHESNFKADHIKCECGHNAYLHIKFWVPESERVPIYICDTCKKIWKEVT